MSKLLINEYPLMVLPKLAAKIGLNEAIMLQQIHYWIADSRCPNQREGRNWHYDTYDGWQKQFPFWSISTIRRTAEKLRKLKLADAKAFNKLSGDSTLWYSINYAELEKLELEVAPPVSKMNTPSCKSEQTPVSKMNNRIYKEQRLRSETSTENNNSVVIEKLYDSANHLVTKQTLTSLLAKYDKEKISEKLALLRHSSGIEDPTRWLKAALKGDWTAPEPIKKQAASGCPNVEETLAYLNTIYTKPKRK